MFAPLSRVTRLLWPRNDVTSRVMHLLCRRNDMTSPGARLLWPWNRVTRHVTRLLWPRNDVTSREFMPLCRVSRLYRQNLCNSVACPACTARARPVQIVRGLYSFGARRYDRGSPGTAAGGPI